MEPWRLLQTRHDTLRQRRGFVVERSGGKTFPGAKRNHIDPRAEPFLDHRRHCGPKREVR
jgi:hypothetical protein